MKQQQLYEQLRGGLVAARERIAVAARSLDGAMLNEHPEPKGWSVAEVLEHLCVTDEAYDAPLDALLRGARPDAGAPAREWKPTFLGGMIAGSLERPRKLSAPRMFQPGPGARNAIVEALLDRETAALKRIDDAQQLDWRALRIASPVLPPWLPKMNLGDAFRIHVVHLARHAAQIERVSGKL